MALQGTLDTFSLPDVLRLLATTAKTGRLRIEGDRGRGSVWLADGGIVDADADRVTDGTPTDEVLFELLRFSEGSFAFEAEEKAANGGEPEDVEALLRRSHSLLSEWRELENVVPSLEHEVRLATDLSTDEVTIDAERWRSLVAVAGGRTVGELAAELGLTELGVSRAVRDLVDLGVAEVDPPGTARSRARRSSADDEPASRPAAPTGEHDAVAPVGRSPVTSTGEVPRAGWRRRTGEVAAVDRDAAPPADGAGLDDTEAIPSPPAPPPAPPERPPKGGLASRLTRGRGSRPAEPPTRGPAPVNEAAGRGQTGRAGDSGRTPALEETGPMPAVGETGPMPAVRDSGRTPRAERPGTSPERDVAGRDRPGAGPSPFDGGRLGPSPIGSQDTGQIPSVSSSSLPPDLHWAAEDTEGGPVNGTGPISSPFSGVSSLGPPRPAPNGPGSDEVAPHVAAMSPEARAAVQAAVGNSGGSTGARLPQGEDLAQRGRLISFLSTVR